MLNNKWIAQSLWLIALLGLLITALAISWQVQSRFHYGYSLWYSVYNIDDHIAEFGPKNHFIKGLERVSSDEHIRLFNEISEAVHNHGQGLAEIGFTLPDSDKEQPLLRQPEIVHLQDVANLIDVLHTAAFVIAALTIVLWGVLPKFAKPIWRIQLQLLLGLIAVVLVALFVIGPKEVFYQLHVWIFPADHQWFFYYQESLMSTLMKAPYLFGGIGAAIAVGGVLIFAAFLWWDLLRTKRALPIAAEPLTASSKSDKHKTKATNEKPQKKKRSK